MLSEQTMESPLLAAEEVSKVYQMGSNSVTALDRVSLTVKEGEFVAIQGTSGSGKSTLLNMLGGLDHPSTGEVFFAAKPLRPLTKKEMARYRRYSVGMIFQNFNLIPTMSALENVGLALAFGGLRGQQRRARAEELLGRVGLADRISHRPSELSDASPLPARSPTGRRCCWLTSPPAISIPFAPTNYWPCYAKWLITTR